MMAQGHGRNVTGNRGIGGGSKPACTSTAKPAKAPPGFKKTGGDGMGSKGTAGSKVSVPKGKMPKKMSGEKY